MMSRIVLAWITCTLAAPAVFAQHGQAREDTSSSVLPDVPMQRDGSGTSWHPDTSPMSSIHEQVGDWGIMIHGAAFVRYNAQDAFERGTRGDRQIDALNWFMAMGRYDFTPDRQITLRSMFSLDPVTVGGSGYPLLFQTGERFEGEPLIDRQHPHDLFTELAIVYGQSISERAGFFAYVGLPGEPALGPPAFMHRPSALHLPDSPLGHHWQDATHILFGVATLGYRYDTFKLDGSVFNGSEPDDERFGIDRPKLNSYSLRLSANPTNRWALQVSRGFLKEPEITHPGEDQWRTTASAMYSAPLSGRSHWSSTFVWGMNEIVRHDAEEKRGGVLQSVLLESDLQLGPQAVYGRMEWVQKAAGELGLNQFDHSHKFGIGAVSVGTSRELVTLGYLRLELGGHASFYAVPADIRQTYGSQPVSLQVYLRLSPPFMGGGHDGMQSDVGTHKMPDM